MQGENPWKKKAGGWKMNIQCPSRVKFIGGGAHHDRRRHEVVVGSGGMLPREIFKSGVPKIAFPAFWAQFPVIVTWLKSLIQYVVLLLNIFILRQPNLPSPPGPSSCYGTDIGLLLLW